MYAREPEGGNSLPVTRWSLVARATGKTETGWRYALSELLTRYLPAMRVHLQARRRLQPNDVDDLLQGFVASKVLEQNLVAVADQRRGRFRTFLLTSLDHYVLDMIRERSGAKRSPGADKSLLSLDDPFVGGEAGDAPAAAAPGADSFDVVWAQQVVREAVERMRFECEVSGRSDLWALFDARVAGVLLQGRTVVPYDELVTRLGFETPAQATNALATAKRMFQRMLRAVVGEYAEDENEIEEELADLKRILKQSA